MPRYVVHRPIHRCRASGSCGSVGLSNGPKGGRRGVIISRAEAGVDKSNKHIFSI
jgi:hypothetical protein